MPRALGDAAVSRGLARFVFRIEQRGHGTRERCANRGTPLHERPLHRAPRELGVPSLVLGDSCECGSNERITRSRELLASEQRSERLSDTALVERRDGELGERYRSDRATKIERGGAEGFRGVAAHAGKAELGMLDFVERGGRCVSKQVGRCSERN